MRVFLLTASALIGFSANSLLTRAALGEARIDPASFTALRLLTGAVTLALLVGLRPQRSDERGSWRSAAALAGYAVFFTWAYAWIGAAVGALVLFGSVQVTMIGTGLARGEWPARIDWLGVALATAGLLVFTVPGATAPDLLGTALMALAGVCWGVYSLAGRRRRDPLGATAGNFLRASAFGVAFVAVFGPFGWKLTATGVALAAASGSLASGVGYTLWYSALPHLAAWRAAVVQLVVPILTALAAAVLLQEVVTLRLAVATALVALGVGLTVWPAAHRLRAA